MEDQQETHAGTQVGRSAVHAGQDVDGGLAERQEDRQELLRNLQQLSVFLTLSVHRDDLGALEQLENHAGRDNRGDT